MKRVNYITAVALLMLTASGCATTYTASSYGAGDLYTSNHKTLVAQRQKQKAEQQKAEAEARQVGGHARPSKCRRGRAALLLLGRCRAQLQQRAGRHLRERIRTPSLRLQLADIPHAVELLLALVEPRPALRLGIRSGILQCHGIGRPGVGRAALHNVDVRLVGGYQHYIRTIFLAVELGVELPRRSVLQLVVGLSALLVVRLELEHLLQSHLERLVVGRTLSPLGLGTSALGSRTLGAAPADAPTRRKLELEQQPSQQQP